MAVAGDTSPRLKEDLDRYLEANPSEFWENSWVQFPRDCMATYTDRILQRQKWLNELIPDTFPR